jgi:hypothetical protein
LLDLKIDRKSLHGRTRGMPGSSPILLPSFDFAKVKNIPKSRLGDDDHSVIVPAVVLDEASNLHLEIREEGYLKKWEEHLNFFSATPFFAPSWLECFRTQNRTPIYLRFLSGGKTVGLMAGLRNEPSNPLLKKFVKILFFYSGPVVVNADRDLTRLCLEKLISYASENEYTHIKLESWDFPCAMNLEGLPFKPCIRSEYILDMRPDLTELEKKMKNRMRDVRAAEKNGLTFHEGNSPEILEDLLALLEATKSVRLAKNYQNYSYFYISYLDKDTLVKLFKSRIVRAYYVRKQDEILSVTLDAVHSKRAYGLFIGTNQVGYQLKANAFIHFKLIQKFKNEGIEFYNLGGVPSDPSSKGIVFFKTSLGAKEQVCAGGRTHHLQSRFFNYLTDAYSRFPDLKIKKSSRKSWWVETTHDPARQEFFC